MAIGIAIYYLMPVFVVGLPAMFFGRKRVKWLFWDYGIIGAIPFALWWVFFFRVYDDGKSLSNVIAEPLLLGCCSAIALLSRVLIGDRIDQRITASSLFIFVCIAAFYIAKCVPGLPE